MRFTVRDALCMINGLTAKQRRVFLDGTGFSSLLHIDLVNSLCSCSLLFWLYDHINSIDMSLNVGPRKTLRILKKVV